MPKRPVGSSDRSGLPGVLAMLGCVVVFVVVLVLAVSSGCSSIPQFFGWADVTVTAADEGGDVRADDGDVVDIVLGNDWDATGCQRRDEQSYDWKVLHVLGQKYEPTTKPPVGDGAGTTTHRFRAIGPGIAHVSLVESDNAGRVCRRYAVDVTVD